MCVCVCVGGGGTWVPHVCVCVGVGGWACVADKHTNLVLAMLPPYRRTQSVEELREQDTRWLQIPIP
jgi:hypothetical protein